MSGRTASDGWLRGTLGAFGAGRGSRRRTRAFHGPRNVRLLLFAGISTVLVTRAALAASGYPQVGDGSLHIAHALWGGLLMLAGLLTALIFTDSIARTLTALLGGIGLGLFVDEVGKFITQDNNYFFRPAAAVIYLLFAGLILLAAQVRTRRSTARANEVHDAAEIATSSLTAGLTAAHRATALRMLDGHDTDAARAVRVLLDAVPERPEPPAPLRRPMAAARWLVERHRFVAALIGLFVLSRVAVDIVFLAQVVPAAVGGHLPAGHDGGAIVASSITRTAEAVLTVAGAIRWRRDPRTGYGYLMAALYINLFITQLFNFTDSQFGALTELPFLLVMLAVLPYYRRHLATVAAPALPTAPALPAGPAAPALPAGPTVPAGPAAPTLPVCPALPSDAVGTDQPERAVPRG